jgi:hypothetical protein
MLKLKWAVILVLCLVVEGCATVGKMNGLSLGMSKEEVIQTMGPPDTTAAEGDTEYMEYRLQTNNFAWLTAQHEWYFVRIRNGVVDAYGRKGDFDSTKDPTVNMNINPDK